MIRKYAVILILGLFVLMLLPLLTELTPFQELSPVAQKYAGEGPDALGSANLVTSVVVTYRGMDTLGEVAVLFAAAAGVGFFLRRKEKRPAPGKREASALLKTGTAFLLPLILLVGVFVFTHGHLTPGGGFQGGVLIASAVVLFLFANRSASVSRTILQWTESLSGVFYVAMGALGLLLAAGFLDSRFLPPGEFGKLFSAGAIPVIYSLIGLKVGSELVGIIDNMRGGAE